MSQYYYYSEAFYTIMCMTIYFFSMLKIRSPRYAIFCSSCEPQDISEAN